eukprot:Skav212079  [mRNA]  locus=scaffold867:162506:165842:- [translate_table: standard]
MAKMTSPKLRKKLRESPSQEEDVAMPRVQLLQGGCGSARELGSTECTEDRCDKAFHQKCHDPPVLLAMYIGNGQDAPIAVAGGAAVGAGVALLPFSASAQEFGGGIFGPRGDVFANNQVVQDMRANPPFFAQWPVWAQIAAPIVALVAVAAAAPLFMGEMIDKSTIRRAKRREREKKELIEMLQRQVAAAAAAEAAEKAAKTEEAETKAETKAEKSAET